MVETMASIYDGFEGFRTSSDEELRVALTSSLVVLDANVLLNLYRYNESTREDLFEVLIKLGDRLWIPHQALREFWRNRLSALGSHSSTVTQTSESLEKQRKSAITNLEAWAKQTALEQVELEELRQRVHTFYDDLIGHIEQRQPSRGGSAWTSNDDVLRRLEHLLEDKIGRPLSDDQMAEALGEAQRRIEKEIPPGFRDAAKADEAANPEGAAGDYLVWLQAITEAADRALDLTLVTGDEKDDWWWLHRGAFLGPRIELSAEFRALTGRTLFALRPRDLLRLADALDVQVREESVDDAERVEATESDQGRWTARGVLELLRLLDQEGWRQADVIRRAAENGGFVDRGTVYAIGDYRDDRMLRGFTRPVTRLTRVLQARGTVAPDVQPMLRPVYIDVKASGFEIPDEVVEILSGEDLDTASEDE